ncbi:RecQ family ATP-dependent DNA helicase [Plebeiibacterium marinum]|uniref:DNA 3'-5' helicase n=1 Tax=Plebeiibacterium marinum TaxID=2992111 RepID=A0AAE3SMP7_9BACT|nr:RecQ family ATP-dependent DNA helicase [Plebeiobacterium marinum]MCW3807775.1 RecQ family ATP-dependent DNA helicase [Plebeiobacterium marinum]
MNNIVFIDTEIDVKSKKILGAGGTNGNGLTLHSSSISELVNFIKNKEYVCGHNIINHDLPYIEKAINQNLTGINAIDTLFLSPLLFPTKPYHALLKDDKLQTEELNNPLNDAIKAKDLFNDELSAFHVIDDDLKQIYYALLADKREFSSFFDFVGYSIFNDDIFSLIKKRFEDKICQDVDLEKLVLQTPIELAYCLALINTNSRYSITPPWVIKNYSEVERVMFLLRNNPCLGGCGYCDKVLDAKGGLKKYFGFDTYRTYGGKALQEQAVNAAISNKSILAVFPTGGGKSITFQVPALMSGESVKGLTVVISPLQSLMKDQVDNLEGSNITEAVTINGLLDPIERAKSFERVESGSASILYISPESLRSRSIERLLLGRNIVRFVIDEAHCFSSWGQDFRVDYLYIGDFIKSLQEKKNLESSIPVSCFTATAKQNVIQDIKDYFLEKLSLRLETFSSKASRTNLSYKVIPKENEEDKYDTLRNLIDGKNCPTIIYVSRTKRSYQIAERLSNDGYLAKPYHGKMDKQEKSENQDAFIRGDVDVMVATSAFGMGVDKKDVGMVIHYELSDSLENYVQEAGRAGRDENITADCYVLFNEEDLSKHFILLNQTKLNIKEIQQIWKAIKDITRFRLNVSNSALEIARKAGWDDNVVEIETRVTTAISALEEAGYLKRGQNMPRIFANSILSKNVQEAIEKINLSEKFNDRQKEHAVRIIKKLFSSKNRKQATDEAAESRIDYISDHLGIVKEEVINVVNLLREEKILADTKDLTAFIKCGENKNRSLSIVNSISRIEKFLVTQFEEQEKSFHLKELNEQAEESGCSDVSPNKIKTIINFWVIKNWLKRKQHDYSKNHLTILSNYSESELKKKLEKRHELASFIVEYLYLKSNEKLTLADKNKEQILVEFSVHELKKEYDNQNALFKLNVSLADVEDALFYLSRIDAIKIEGGFLVVYNKLSIERLEQDNKKRYKVDDYRKLNQFYENKVQQIHIVGEYAKKMIRDYKEALQFVEDYFQLNYASFLNKYFKGSRKDEIKRNITPSKFRQLFGELSPAQLGIIKDNESPYIAVAAGPGSGKTRVLVHKLASLLLMEDVKHEQLLMVTFSRAAATEFKKRLFELIGNAAAFIEIKTFHAYCFDLLGKVGTIEKSQTIINKTVEKIQNKDIEQNRITKTVLVIDEAQDMDIHEFELIKALMEHNEEMRVIAVGDDDQNIYEFRGASSQYLEQFISEQKAKKVELIENYRSKANLVEFTNQFVDKITHRLKETPIVPHTNETGQVKLIKYSASNLIEPVVRNILSSDLIGTTCVLTHTNSEALQITGLLIHGGLQAKLIQTNEGFSLYNLVEVRYFIEQLSFAEEKYTITEEDWKAAKRKLWNKYKESTKIDICINLIKDFELSNPKKKYQSDFEVFVRESKLEDFVSTNGETIFVSTIHKAKGKEFDNVFLMLNGFNPDCDAKKRELYVAMTRAKQNLTIHINGNYLDDIACQNLERINNNSQYEPSNLLVIQLSHKDIWLDYFISRQKLIANLKSGDILMVNNDGCFDENGNCILKFSSRYNEIISNYQNRGYKLKESVINYIVYWKKEELENEIKIVLPELKFIKADIQSVNYTPDYLV